MIPTVVVLHNVCLEQYLLSESVLKIPFLGFFGQRFRLHSIFWGVWKSPLAGVWGFGFKVLWFRVAFMLGSLTLGSFGFSADGFCVRALGFRVPV